MRVTTDFFVSALVRSIFSAGGFAAVLTRGSAEAGAVFVLHRHARTGLVSLYGPAAQTGYGEGKPADRRFQLVLAGVEPEAADAKLERERRFDPDLWLVEVEPAGDDIAGLLDVVEA